MKVLSNNNSILKTLFPALISLFGSVFVLFLLKEHHVLKYVSSIGFLTLGFLWSRDKYNKSYNLFYDSDYLILKNNIVDRKILLQNIESLELTSNKTRIMGFQYSEYIIEFKNETGSIESVGFFVSNMNSSFYDFQDLIKMKSPRTLIESIASR